VSKLVIEGVGRTFPGVRHGLPTEALQPVSLTVSDNDFITILGPSGCGKSTLLRIVAGLDTPTRGRVLLDGLPVTAAGADRGMVFQSYTLFPWLTVRQNICFGLRERGVAPSAQDEIARYWLGKVGLTGFEHHYPKMLSGGMQQRTAIARALANDPKILLLDEPFGALDPGIRRDMQELTTTLWRDTGMTVFMVTHDIAEAFKLGTRLIVFDRVRPEDPTCSATITYDLPLSRNGRAASRLAERATAAAEALDTTLSILSNENPQEEPKP
jgi:NitT/TauT family transport system ATP-binding protein